MFPFLVTWDADEIKKSINQNTEYKMIAEHKHKLQQSASLFKNVPALDENVNITPLNQLNKDDNWGEMIGFGESPEVVLPANVEDYSKASKFDGKSFLTNNGEGLPNFPAPTYDASRDDVPINTPLPHFFLVNSDVTPIKCCQSFMLQCFIASRAGSQRTVSREELINTAECIHQLNKTILIPDKTPLQINA